MEEVSVKGYGLEVIGYRGMTQENSRGEAQGALARCDGIAT